MMKSFLSKDSILMYVNFDIFGCTFKGCPKYIQKLKSLAYEMDHSLLPHKSQNRVDIGWENLASICFSLYFTKDALFSVLFFFTERGVSYRLKAVTG